MKVKTMQVMVGEREVTIVLEKIAYIIEKREDASAIILMSGMPEAAARLYTKTPYTQAVQVLEDFLRQ